LKILVLGATGATGQHVVQKALDGGHQVTVLIRDASKVTNPQVTVVTGRASSVADLAKVFGGQDAVVRALGPRAQKDPICAEAAEAVVQAMKEAHVSRLVWISAAGVGDSAGPVTRASFIFGRIIMPLFLKHTYANHLRAEQTLRASALEWTIVRPVELVDKPTGNAVTANLGETRLLGLKIARADVASFLVREVAENKYVRQLPLLHA